MKRRVCLLAMLGGLTLVGGTPPSSSAPAPVQQLRNAALRLKLHLEQDPRYFLDEPVSARMRVLVKECERLLDTLDQEPVSEVHAKSEIQRIKQALESLKQVRYNRILPEKKQSFVTVYYFSAVD